MSFFLPFFVFVFVFVFVFGSSSGIFVVCAVIPSSARKESSPFSSEVSVASLRSPWPLGGGRARTPRPPLLTPLLAEPLGVVGLPLRWPFFLWRMDLGCRSGGRFSGATTSDNALW